MNKVKKTTLDNAIAAAQNLNAAWSYARSEGKKLSLRKRAPLYEIIHGYCDQLAIEAETGKLKGCYFWDIVWLCVDWSDTPNETAYKLLALLGGGVQ